MVAFQLALALFCSIGLFCARAACVLGSHDINGQCMRWGTGTADGAALGSLVGDNGQAAFIAPMPERDDSIAAELCASYLVVKSDCSELRPGLIRELEPIAGVRKACNVKIAANAELTRFAVLSDVFASSLSTNTVLEIVDGKGVVQHSDILGSSPNVKASQCGVSMSSDGHVALAGGRNSLLRLYECTGSAWKKKNLPVAYKAGAACISGDGSFVFFTSEEGSSMLAASQFGVFAYNVHNGEVSLLAAGGNAKQIQDAELCCSSDGTVVAYRHTPNKLRILVGGKKIDVAATGARCPSLNATGRYMAYQAKGENGFAQIFRFERVASKTLLASCNDAFDAADAECLKPSISPDGCIVSFSTSSTNLVDGLNGRLQVLLSTVAEKPFALSISVGWNMLSIPCEADADSIARLRAFTTGSIWSWNGCRFECLDEVPKAGQGFFVYSKKAGNVPVTGNGSIVENMLPAKTGWNLFGLLDSNRVIPATASDKLCFALVNGMYVYTRKLELGRAYWWFNPAK